MAIVVKRKVFFTEMSFFFESTFFQTLTCRELFLSPRSLEIAFMAVLAQSILKAVVCRGVLYAKIQAIAFDSGIGRAFT